MSGGAKNPRRANGTRRTKLLRRLRAAGGACWVCRLPVDWGVPHGHPRAGECDELVPVSRGGSPYDPANVAPAHRCCNSWRSNRSVAYVGRVRAEVARACGPWATPEEFVAMARAVERGVAAPVSRVPPMVTTKW